MDREEMMRTKQQAAQAVRVDATPARPAANPALDVTLDWR
jgi:hypothetical protein